MYTSNNTLELIIGEIPDFGPFIQKIRNEWTGGSRTIGLDICSFSDFISDKLENNVSFDYQKAFNVMEKLLTEGDKEVSVAIGLQFFENILNLSANGHFPIESFFNYLGKESKAFCKANEEFWGIENSNFYEDK